MLGYGDSREEGKQGILLKDRELAMAAAAATAVRNPKILFLIWSLCTIFFFSLLQMAIKNSASPAIWLQNSTVFQFSMFYAPHHITTVPATESQIEAEAAAVRTAVETFCPFKIVLDRVVLTSTGVLLGCWQVTAGADPATIRATLRSAFQRSPDKQLYDTAILHTSFARLPGNPTTPSLQPRTTRRFPMMQCSFSTS